MCSSDLLPVPQEALNFQVRVEGLSRVALAQFTRGRVGWAYCVTSQMPEVIEHDVTTWAAEPSELVVADPSRAGLGPDGAAVVDATGATRVVLVSCDANALARDAEALRRFGFDLTRATPLDPFPHTPHVEVVSVLDR